MKNKKHALYFKNNLTLLVLSILCFASLLSACQTNQGHFTAITNIHLVPMTEETIIKNQTVLIQGSKIIQIGNADEFCLPENTQIILGNGNYLMPGLADMHMHTRQDWTDSEIWPVNPIELFLANGVTTIRDFGPYGTDITYPFQWKDEISAGNRIGPTIYTSGRILFTSPLKDPQGMVSENHDLGFDFLKLYSYLSKDDFHQAMLKAKELEMYTAGHIPYPVGLDGVITEGMNEVAHVEELLQEFLVFDRNKELSPDEWLTYIIDMVNEQLDPFAGFKQVEFEIQNNKTLIKIINQLQSAEIPICTTMVVDDLIQLKLLQPDIFLERPENIFFETGYLEIFQQGKEKHQVILKGIEELANFKYDLDRWVLTGLHDGGVQLLLGTDAGTGGMGIVPGFSVHDELDILVENGFSPYEALLTSTVNAAEVIEKMVGDNNFGTIEVGKRADLILVRGNPLQDVGNIRNPLGVMAAGRWYPEDLLSLMITIPGTDITEVTVQE